MKSIGCTVLLYNPWRRFYLVFPPLVGKIERGDETDSPPPPLRRADTHTQKATLLHRILKRARSVVCVCGGVLCRHLQVARLKRENSPHRLSRTPPPPYS